MTDPTPEQTEAAYQAWLNFPRKRGPQNAEDAIRAALVAAAGVTPQEPGAAKAIYISPSLPGMIRNLWKSDPSENSVRTALKLAGDLIQELIDIRAAPAQVGEAELAEVVRDVIDRRPYPEDTRREIRGLENAVARAVAEWLRGGGR